MKISGTHYRTIWRTDVGDVRVIDQSRLPFTFETLDLVSLEDAAKAIKTMVVRGAPLIGATAAYGLALAVRSNPSDAHMDHAARLLMATRPTAHNLSWALARMRRTLDGIALPERADAAFRTAALICDEDVEQCKAIGAHGLDILRRTAALNPGRLNVLTHCNAGWLACVDWGTALAPVYRAHDAGIPIHVWVDETRPRNQGASLTAFAVRSFSRKWRTTLPELISRETNEGAGQSHDSPMERNVVNRPVCTFSLIPLSASRWLIAS